jgi:nucleotide-binding universal stress UspA family protein
MSFNHILCVTDLSDLSKNAETVATKLAFEFQANLSVLCCGENYSHAPNNYFDENVIQPIDSVLDKEAFEKLLSQKKSETMLRFEENMEKLNLPLGDKINYEVNLENEVSSAIDYIDKNQKKFDLIIVAKENSSYWERLLFGAPGKEICDESKITTLLIPAGKLWESWRPSRIVICKSIANSHLMSLEKAFDFAKSFQSSLEIFHVIDENEQQFANNFTHIFPMDYIPSRNGFQTLEEEKQHAKSMLNEMIDAFKVNHPSIDVSCHIEIGNVGEKVVSFMEKDPKNNLLVVGSRGENALKRFLLGSKTDELEEACPAPVLIVFELS